MHGVICAVLAVAAFGGMHAQSTVSQATTTTTIICWGSRGVCLTWHHPGSDVWLVIPGTPIREDPYPYPMASTCPAGSEPGDAIFIFDPGTTTNAGRGYVGTSVCADDARGAYSFEPDRPGVRIYRDYDEWMAASGSPLR